MDEETETPSEPAKAKPSQVPSWVTLGFVLGALFVMALPRREAEEARPRPAAGEAAAAKPAKPSAAPRITTIEAVFAAWDKYAVWSSNTTEVALWNTDTMSYSDCYEVMKTADGYYFRSISGLTRQILTHGVVQESPLQFTETLRQRQEWLGEVDRENLKALSEAARQTLPVITEESQKK
jgi:hypothetical protein